MSCTGSSSSPSQSSEQQRYTTGTLSSTILDIAAGSDILIWLCLSPYKCSRCKQSKSAVQRCYFYSYSLNPRVKNTVGANETRTRALIVIVLVREMSPRGMYSEVKSWPVSNALYKVILLIIRLFRFGILPESAQRKSFWIYPVHTIASRRLLKTVSFMFTFKPSRPQTEQNHTVRRILHIFMC